MKKLQCTSCGAPINPKTGICEYCGSVYLIEKNFPMPSIINVEHPKVERVAARISINNELAHRDPDGISQYAIQNISHNIADGLAEFLKISTTQDLVSDSTIIQGELRILPPSFKF